MSDGWLDAGTPAPAPVSEPQPLPAPLLRPPVPLATAPQPAAQPQPAPVPLIPAPEPYLRRAPEPVLAAPTSPSVPAVSTPPTPPVVPAAPVPQPPVPVRTVEDAPYAINPDTAAVVDNFNTLLRSLYIEGVSDIHFVGGELVWPVRFGRPVKSSIAVSDNDILAWADAFGAGHGGAEELMHGEDGSLECMAVVGPVGAQLRLRMAFRRQATGFGLTLRFVPEEPPRLTDTVFHRNPVPQVMVNLTLNSPAGLILLCGPTGSGKTTALAALLAEVNATQTKHIYTVEDPIEFIHKSNMSVVTQREIGLHAGSFSRALRDSLRARPNIILVGELLDLDTVRVAIEAANKGHLVFATSHASSAAEAISSLVSQFPGSEQNQVATALSQALRAVMVQRLVPTIDDRMVPARELLLNTISVASKVRGLNFGSLTQALVPTEGMWPFEDDLAMLFAQDQINETTAVRFCNDRDSMMRKLQNAKDHKSEVAAAAGTRATPEA